MAEAAVAGFHDGGCATKKRGYLEISLYVRHFCLILEPLYSGGVWSRPLCFHQGKEPKRRGSIGS